VVLPCDRWSAARHQWEWVEGSGFARGWTYDHLCWSGMADGPWHAAYPVLAAAAMVTEQVRLGTLVTSPNFRQPVTLAREVITLDDLSGGRFDLGIGAGSQGPDATILGQEPWSPDERNERFAQFIELLDQLLTHPRTTRRSGHYAANDAPMTPGCLQSPRVPFTIASAGKSFDTVVRFAKRWVTIGPTGPGPRDTDSVLRRIQRQNADLNLALEQAGRGPDSVERVVLITDTTPIDSLDQFEALAGPYEEMGFHEIVLHHPEQGGPYGGDLSLFEQIATR